MLRHFFDVPAGTQRRGALRRSCGAASAELDPRLESFAPRSPACSRKPGTSDGAEEVEHDKRATFEAVGARRHRASEQAPVVMIIEDLHWIDDPSREMLELAASRMPTGARHDADQPPSRVRAALAGHVAFTQLHLRAAVRRGGDARSSAPSPAASCRPSSRSASAPRPRATRSSSRRSPARWSRTARCRGATGASSSTRPVAEISIPETVQEVIGARLDRLGPRRKRVAQVAAVLGRQFSRDAAVAAARGRGHRRRGRARGARAPRHRAPQDRRSPRTSSASARA